MTPASRFGGIGRRALVRMAAALAVVATAVGVLLAAASGRSHPAKAAATADVGAPTAIVQRRNLSDTQDVDATLGFADDRTVIARSGGILTTVAAAGSVLRPGDAIYSLDGSPVVLLDGRQPAFRGLSEGVSNGPDVRELEANLVKLGFDPARLINVDDHFTAATRAAIEALQRHLGTVVTGDLPLGSVAFLPGERRVTSVFVNAGDAVASGTQILTSASTARIATITLDTSQRSLVAVGMPVSVILPDSSSRRGTVAAVGATATQTQDSSGGAASTVSVTVAIGAHLSEPDGTPVTVRLTNDTHRNVLAVPVTALLATSGGKRSLEVVERDGSTRIVPVRTGLYAGGFVEIAGANVREGTRVLDAPSS